MAASRLSKFWLSRRLHVLADTYNKSPAFSIFENALEKTRQFLRSFYGKNNTLSNGNFRPQHRLPVEFFENSGKSAVIPRRFSSYYPGLIYKLTSQWSSESLAGTIGRRWARRFMFQGRGPTLCFVGFAFAKKPSLLTAEEERESSAYFIRDSFSKIPWQNIGLNIDKDYGFNRQFSLSDIKIGDIISKGSNAAVYSACLTDKDEKLGERGNSNDINVPSENNAVLNEDAAKADERKENDNCFTYSRLIISHSEGEQKMKPLNPVNSSEPLFLKGKFGKYDMAVKVMFNYNAASNAYAIWSAMNKETLPCIGEFYLGEEVKHNTRKKILKPHPNVVEMYFAFADQTPLLKDAYKHFPHALPVRLYSDGCGRNMTLFMVMKRYHCNLKDYLVRETPSPHTCLLLFTQLLEALVHLHQSGIAHRDLKTDNILLDLTQGVDSPKLVVSDFGCCLESLVLNYPSHEICKGGNLALMAPEVVNAEAGPFSQIDYSRSDLWTSGTLAYEIFGADNPFYARGSGLRSDSYKMDKLPALPSSAPSTIQRLVKAILHRSPDQRPNPNFVATVCQILLHAPPDLLCARPGFDTGNVDSALKWMFFMSAKTYLEGSIGKTSTRSVEFELRHTFCSRIQYLEVKEAINYILKT